MGGKDKTFAKHEVRWSVIVWRCLLPPRAGERRLADVAAMPTLSASPACGGAAGGSPPLSVTKWSRPKFPVKLLSGRSASPGAPLLGDQVYRH
jgi:hypothetical protein